MAILTREQILDAHDLKKIEVKVPEWGGSVFVKTLTATERDRFESAIYHHKTKIKIANVRARLAALAVIDEKGVRLFTPDDIVALGKKSATALDRVFQAACKLNKMTPDDVEELEKNSASIPAASSVLS